MSEVDATSSSSLLPSPNALNSSQSEPNSPVADGLHAGSTVSTIEVRHSFVFHAKVMSACLLFFLIPAVLFNI